MADYGLIVHYGRDTSHDITANTIDQGALKTKALVVDRLTVEVGCVT